MIYKILRNLFLLYIILISLQLNAVIPSNGVGARSSSLGSFSITHCDFWSQFNNQAGLANINSIQAGISYQSKFMIKSLAIKSVGFIIPINKGSFGFNIVHWGNENYNKMNIGLAYGRKLSDNFSIGLKFNYYSLNQSQDLGSKGKVSFEGGFIYTIDNTIKLGVHLYNPFCKSTNNNELILPEIYQFGFEYLISKNLKGFFEISNHSELKTSIHLGIEYTLKIYSFRFGYSSWPDQLTFGFGINYKKFQLDMSNSMHSNLGNSPQISLIYIF
jgi:hypothetical protein